MRMSPLFRSMTILALLAPIMVSARSPIERAGGAAGQTFEEFEARRMNRLMALDIDGDGRISRAELAGGTRSGQDDLARRFARLDANADGTIDRGEIDAMIKRRFARMDRDHDGALTAAERATVHLRRPEDNNDPNGQAR